MKKLSDNTPISKITIYTDQKFPFGQGLAMNDEMVKGCLPTWVPLTNLNKVKAQVYMDFIKG